MALTFKPKPTATDAPAADPAFSPMLTTEEVAKLINLSVDYLKRDRWLSKSGGTPPVFPFYKIGGAVRYRQSDVVSIIEQGRVG